MNQIRNISEIEVCETHHWYALYTRPRFEKKVDVLLKEKHLQSFLPLLSKRKFWSDRVKTVEEPLFASYVFVYANAKERPLALETHGVLTMVRFDGHPAIVSDDEIERVKRILQCGYDPQPYQYLKYGDEVEVINGPLKGMRGIFVEERSGDRLIISIHAIRQSLAVKVDRGMVSKVNDFMNKITKVAL